MTLMEVAQLLGNIGEFVGSAAILVTLLYLSIQVRESRKQQAVASRQQREESIRAQQMGFAISSDLVEAVCKARDAVGEEPRGFTKSLVDRGLSRSEAERVFSYMTAGIRIQASTFYTSADEEQRQQADHVGRLLYGRGLGALFWDSYSKSMGDGLGPFRAYLDELLSGPSVSE